MRLDLDRGIGIFAIRSYGAGAIVVNDEILQASFIVTPERLIRQWPPQRWDQVTPEHFGPVLELEPEVVLFGTGSRLCFPRAEIGMPFLHRNIGFEVMATAAACRSYAVLMSEGRRVAAALLMIDE